MTIRLALVTLLSLLFSSTPVAHETRPSLLEITETDDSHFSILWKQPYRLTQRLALVGGTGEASLLPEPDSQYRAQEYAVSRWHAVELPRDSVPVRVAGLEQGLSNVLVVVNYRDGDRRQTLLSPRAPAFSLARNNVTSTASNYLNLGIHHILGGADHLLFLLGLLLLLRGPALLIKTVTAFSIAHCLTLALVTLGQWRPDVTLIESLVALSIATVAAEVIRSFHGEITLMQRFPWLLAFTFGLLHGSAFGGELLNIGLPRGNIWLALVLFNAGIEIGQLIFIAAAVTAYFALRSPLARLPDLARWVPPYAIGCAGAFWFLQRAASALPTITTWKLTL